MDLDQLEAAPDFRKALEPAGVNWRVFQKNFATEDGYPVSGFEVNIRNSHNRALWVVTDHYKVVQNKDTFAFTDKLLGEGTFL